MPTRNRASSAACVQQLRPGAPRARAFSGVVRFAPTPAYKLRRFEREVRVHAHIERFGPVTAESQGLGASPYPKGLVTDWSAA